MEPFYRSTDPHGQLVKGNFQILPNSEEARKEDCN